MKEPPRTGMIGTRTFVVGTEHTIDFADDVMPAVLCTPWLIWFLEHAAREAVLPVLDPDESTVGVSVEVEHFAPTPPGREVTCRARSIFIDGTLISFQIEAYDEAGPIARGHHKLRIIKKERFARRVARGVCRG